MEAMNSMKRLVVSAVLTLCASPGWAQNPVAPQKGSAFQSAGAKYRVVGGMRAMTLAEGQSSDAALASVGASATALVETKGRFILFRGGGAAPLASAMAVKGTSTLPVVENVRTGGLGVVPGTLIVVVKPPFDAESIARDNHLELVRAFPGISTAVYRVPDGRDIQAVALELQGSPSVGSVEVEVVEHLATPQ
jgi:hypothetical protein